MRRREGGERGSEKEVMRGVRERTSWPGAVAMAAI